MLRNHLTLASVSLCAFNLQHTQGQCEFDWLPSHGVPGLNGSAYAATLWDPDGDGPLPEQYVVAGGFTTAGSVPVNNIAKWDGSTWSAIGEGLAWPVHVLTVHDGELVAAMEMEKESLTTGLLARFDGQSWHMFESAFNNAITALKSFNGELIAIGRFSRIDDLEARRIARWNGTSWQSFGSGIDVPIFWPGPNALFVYNGSLIVGGGFSSVNGVPVNSIARWNGQAWQPMGNPQMRVYSFVERNKELLIGGQNAQIKRWVGASWVSIDNTPFGLVRSMIVDGNNDLIIAGSFGQLDSFARWDGTSWSSVGLLLEQQAPSIWALTPYNGEIMAAGEQFNYIENTKINNIGRWNGIEWRPVGNGLNSEVISLIELEDKLFVTGHFSAVGGIRSDSFAIFDGESWSGFGIRNNPSPRSTVFYDDSVVVGGIFGSPGNYVARWNRDHWEGLGNGVNSAVWAMTVFQGDLIVGGWFTQAGELPASRIARWDGVEWHSLLGGITGPSSPSPSVYALLVHNGQLIVGGSFNSVGGQAANNIAMWDGESWHSLGMGFNSEVRSLGVFDGQLIAGGKFTMSGSATTRRIARWNGTQWTNFSIGFTSSAASVNALSVFNGKLVAGGKFSAAGAISLNNIAQWNGLHWETLSTGLSGSGNEVLALGILGGELIVGGDFVNAGSHLSAHLATWARVGQFGDTNNDGVLNLADLPHMLSCFNGPRLGTAMGDAFDCLCIYNSDGDSDCDLTDFSAIQREFAGSN